MTAAIVAGIFLAVCTYVACLWLTDYVTRVSFTSEEAVKKNVGEAYESLQKFIDRRDVKATDSDKLKKWVEEYEDVYLYIWVTIIRISLRPDGMRPALRQILPTRI